MKRILVKVYAGLHPADGVCADSVRQAAAAAMPNSGDPWLFHEGDLLRISFEGLYFPEDEVSAALAACLPAQARGRVDVLDLEGWELRRYAREYGSFRLSRRGLNEVLDSSGL
jgi:hypothetical protein